MPATALALKSIGIGTCYCHDSPINTCGIIITGSNLKLVNDLPSAKIFNLIMANCGHVSMLVTGSQNVLCEGIGQATVNSVFSGCFNGIIVTGSDNHFSG
jgi:hypothetical protein